MLHLITGMKDGPANRWVDKYIFPGGYIPTLSEMVNHLSARDFHIWDVENLGPHYRLTLDEWSERFERAVPVIREKFDERFVRMWRLSTCAVSPPVSEKQRLKCIRFLFRAASRRTYRSHAKISTRRKCNNELFRNTDCGWMIMTSERLSASRLRERAAGASL